MKQITIKIEFFSPWNCSSGLSAGSDADSLVIKTPDNLPYIPGRTVKGLIRNAIEDYISLSGKNFPIDEMFGKGTETDNDEDMPKMGHLFFSDATLAHNEAQSIIAGRLSDFLYQNRTSTAIDSKSGIAKDHSLRTIEVTVPCTLYATVLNVDDNLIAIMQQALGLIKNIGTGRNRGMGRCRFSIEGGGEA